ncbi:hypothetical protein BJ508DRAFT_418179 [Ascobolus immersus RN42]|uniref:tRNA(Phe) (4-demethylwyosine(37)-C(7)) aminocarboxypropyltransferase n=1 Tax=Ascobolus immersus RN42 TaxID=1160509 RepID=A0A3N4HSB6_ASCIM|nr:hypothetical protein BJ508DRAFT_418179 [Ascobolus immersus RN42]
MAKAKKTVLVIECPSSLVKRVKTALEAGNTFGKKIEPVEGGDGGVASASSLSEELKSLEVSEGKIAKPKERMRIFTTLSPSALSVSSDVEDVEADKARRLERLLELLFPASGDRAALRECITLGTHTISAPSSTTPVITGNPLDNAISKFICRRTDINADQKAELMKTAPKRYSIYTPMLLLSTPFSSAWSTFLDTLSEEDKEAFYASLCQATGTTHLAINAPIPASDYIRRPTSLTPLYGDFGTTDYDACKFEEAFWVKTIQNGIDQTWAPMFTMFSRGNVTEKARVLKFDEVAGNEVVDFYAGIGYFTFSYVKAGAKTVWAWEVNPWSVEALRRGARMNGWSCVRIKSGEELSREKIPEDTQIVIFEESNEEVQERFYDMAMRLKWRPFYSGVRHVNLGLLPSSKAAWYDACYVVSKERGTIHVHENFGEDEFEKRTEEVRRVIDYNLMDLHMGSGMARVSHVERVKTFAPGVVHVVVDVEVRERIQDF